MIRPRFGVEIEFVRPSNVTEHEIADALTGSGLSCRFENYNHHTRDYWKLTTDSSCGLELVTPPLFWEDRHAIREATRVLKSCGATVNRDCGFHVHHEWPWVANLRLTRRDRASRLIRVVQTYERCLPLLTHLMPASRFSTSGDPGAMRYCRWNDGKIITSDWNYEGIPGVQCDDRAKYVAVNIQNLDQRTTIEFRQHQGTLNATKMVAWVELTRQIVHAASLRDDQVEADDRIELVFGKISSSSWRYMSERCVEGGTTMEAVVEEILAAEGAPA